MQLGIDHLVIAVSDPDAAVEQLSAKLGVSPGGGGRHDRLGTFNRLIWLGDSYLELVGVFDRALAVESWLGGPTVRALDGGGGLATWAIVTDDIVLEVAHLRAAGSDLGAPTTGKRRRADRSMVRWRIAIPSSLGPDRPPFLIEHDATAAEWSAADRAARAAGRGRLLGIELPVRDVIAVAAEIKATVGVEWRPREGSPITRGASVGDQFARLREEPRPEPAIIHVAVQGGAIDKFELLACTWILNL